VTCAMDCFMYAAKLGVPNCEGMIAIVSSTARHV
jgi:hypothetical protein